MSAGLTIDQKKWWEPIVNGLRWVAFIPGGFLAGMLAGAMTALIIGLNIMWIGGESIVSPMSGLVSAGVFGYTAVTCTALIAPTPKKAIPAIVMAVFIFMLYGIGILACLVEKDWFGIVQSVVGVVAAAVAMHSQITESASQ